MKFKSLQQTESHGSNLNAPSAFCPLKPFADLTINGTVTKRPNAPLSPESGL